MYWWLWLLLGVIALAGEAISLALFLLYVGVAAFAAAVLALLGVGPAAQAGVFVALSVLLIGLVRPRMLQALSGRVPHRLLTNQGQLVDRRATVTQEVTPDGGLVRVGTAEFWSARATPPTHRIAVGAAVRIVYVSGLTAYVTPVLDPDPSAAAHAPQAAELQRTAREEH